MKKLSLVFVFLLSVTSVKASEDFAQTLKQLTDNRLASLLLGTGCGYAAWQSAWKGWAHTNNLWENLPNTIKTQEDANLNAKNAVFAGSSFYMTWFFVKHGLRYLDHASGRTRSR